MFRSHTCGELNLNNLNESVVLSGWVHKNRDLGGMTFIDIRDRYGVTQLSFNMEKDSELCNKARKLGREFVIQINGIVIERVNKNKKIHTGEIEVEVKGLLILNPSKTPPFTIEENTDGGEDLRMQYRYLDIRRDSVKNNLLLRNQVSIETRKYLDNQKFIEVETPYLMKSTPEGARDFIVPSRMNKGEFYALPQSPQTFKQLLMVAGLDKYYQIVKCFRDEDLRSDRQPEFTQIDCEMSFVTQDEVLSMFEGLLTHLLKKINNVSVSKFPKITYEEAMNVYGTDKPDIRFEMHLIEMSDMFKNTDFKIFEDSESIIGMRVDDCASYSRKNLDRLTEFIKTPQVGGSHLFYCKYNEDGSSKSSIDKFFSENDRKEWGQKLKCKDGDLLIMMAGDLKQIRKIMGLLRLHLAEELGLRNPKEFAPLWVIDFPLLEWDEETNRYHAMHHPFTSPKNNDLKKIETHPESVFANAYDLILNGNEIGGGSIRIHDKKLQKNIFKHLGFSEQEAKQQFGFLMNAFEYGAPPHGGIALGFDRLCAILGEQENIKNFIAFPKNNSGRDVMINSPSNIDNIQLEELGIELKDY